MEILFEMFTLIGVGMHDNPDSDHDRSTTCGVCWHGFNPCLTLLTIG